MGSMTGSSGDVHLTRPLTRADLSVFPLDDELVIYDPENGESFILNQTGRLVWERCDGTRTLDEIADEIATLLHVSTQIAFTDIAELLESLRQANLLTAR